MDQTGAPRLRQFLEHYKHILLILLIGIVLMLLPTGPKNEKHTVPESTAAPASAPESFQKQLSALLSRMDGAGKVEVLLSEANGEQTQYQLDKTMSGDGNSRTDTVILTDAARNQLGLIARVDPPVYQGAIILCQGADRAAVRLAITEAVANATGLGYNKITVLKMK